MTRRRSGLGALTGAIAALVLAACGERANPLYCDDDLDCAPSQCDLATHECVGETVDAGAPDAAPVIDGGRCQGAADCTADDAPICDQQSGFCRPCGALGGDGECALADPDQPLCDDGRCVACRSSSDCAGATSPPICDLDEQVCRGCAPGPAGDSECLAADPGAPRCLDERCVECLADGDCLSEICDESARACVAEAGVVYVGKTGNDEPSCGSRAEPCLTVAAGLARIMAGRTFLRVRPGEYLESVVIDGVQVHLVGDGALLSPRLVSNTAGLRATGGAEVTVEGVRIEGAFSGTAAHGAVCTTGASLRLIATVIAENAALGVDANDCTLVIERSRIARNDGGGLRITDSDYELVNNFVVANGSSAGGGSLIGGLVIIGDPITTAGRLAFNTIANNAKSAVTFASGVDCAITTPVSATSNIVYGNLPTAQVGGMCNWTFSDIQGGAPGEGNVDLDPAFVDVASDDYHLSPTSPCRDRGEPAAGVTIDFDGQSRPLGAAPEIGADELDPL